MNASLVEFLIAEDNEDDIVLINESFTEAGIANRLNIVRDGEDALAFLRKQGKYVNAPSPGIVILDVNMPKKSGFDVLREIKGDPLLRHLPVVMLTTSQRDVDVVKSYSDGACSYIAKPARFEDFREVVKQFAGYWLGVVRLPHEQVGV